MRYDKLTEEEKKTREEAKKRLSNVSRTMMLPEICLSLRTALNGAADPITFGEVMQISRDLRIVHYYWLDSVGREPWGAEMDEAVNALVLATIGYIDGCVFRDNIQQDDLAIPIHRKP